MDPEPSKTAQHPNPIGGLSKYREIRFRASRQALAQFSEAPVQTLRSQRPKRRSGMAESLSVAK